MKLQNLLVAFLCGAVLNLVPADPAQAQRSRDSRSSKPEVLFPDAKREAPKAGSSRLNTKLQKAFDLYEKEKFDEAIALAETVAGDERAGPYQKAQAFYIAGVSAQQVDESSYGRAISYFTRAVEADGLDNNSHYQIMQQLAQMHLAEERYDEALKYIERFLAETHQETPDALVVRGNVLFRLERFPEAVESIKKAIDLSPKPQPSWQQLLMATYVEAGQPDLAAEVAERIASENPDDKRVMLNLIAIYMQADQPEKAGGVFDRMRSAGQLTESRDYENAYRLLANIEGRENDAIELINEGLSKEILQPSHEVYSFLGQSYYFTDRPNEAIDAWKKAAPLAQDGETFLNLAKVLTMEERYAEGKAAAQQALAKGVKKPGDAWMTIARAEYGDDGKNRAGVLAAYREAAKYPETKDQALRQIQQMTR